jgi:uncharacterized protein (DUF1800 family)
VSEKGSGKHRAVVAHVLRRLSMGPQPDLVADLPDADAAIARALDLSAPAATPPTISPPPDYDAAQTAGALQQPITFWLQQMVSSPRLVEERLVWFWHDHFATSVAKVRVPYLMWQQHLLLRKHATGSFADLLHAVSKDPAMLWYLDGITNTVRERNENFGREVMELFTLGRGNYTEQDVVEASRSFTGWAVNIPGRPQSAALSAVTPPWTAAFLPARHDGGTKTLLGTTANLDLDGALDVLLNHEATAPRIAGKLYTELVGVAPSKKTATRLGKVFRDQGYAVMPLVEAITSEPAFTSEQSIAVKTRSPVEKLVGIVQAIPPTNLDVGRVTRRAPANNRPTGLAGALRTLGYVPFVPPNVAGYSKGLRLAGPHQLIHAFDLLSVYPSAPVIPTRLDDLLDRYALVDVSDQTRTVLARESEPTRRLALVVASPEYAVV